MVLIKKNYRVPGAHPSGFEPDWNAFFNFVGNGCTRSSAEMLHVEPQRHKLRHANSKSPINPKEKSVSMLAELIDLFVPRNGTVIDMYAGTMTLGIAAIRANRNCVLIEKNELIFTRALLRLGVIRQQMDRIQSLKKEESIVSFFDDVKCVESELIIECDEDTTTDNESSSLNSDKTCMKEHANGDTPEGKISKKSCIERCNDVNKEGDGENKLELNKDTDEQTVEKLVNRYDSD